MTDLNVIDISKWQASLRISDIANLSGASCKLTESTSYVSPVFSSQYHQLVDCSKLKAAYHFAGSSIYKRIGNVDAEANFFYNHFKPYLHTAIPILDWEPYGYGMTAVNEIKWAIAFCNMIHNLSGGVWPVIYMDFNHVNMWHKADPTLAASLAKNVSLWVAGGSDYDRVMGFTSHPRSEVIVPNYWHVFGWQYTSHGKLNGYSPLDLNSVYITSDQWKKHANPSYVSPTPKPSHSPMHNVSVPSLIQKGKNKYFGSISGPANSLGGAHAYERPPIQLLQRQLIYLGYVPGVHDINSNWANGIYDTMRDAPNTGATSKAVTAFQHHHMPNTKFYGQVWWDDWTKLASL